MEGLILGASGLIGKELLGHLLQDPSFKKVKIIVRKTLPIYDNKLEQIIADYNTIEEQEENLKCDVIFCCIGSTKKKTPDLKEYYQIDHDYPYLIGKLGLKQGAKSFHLVSSIGANTSSSMFYTRTKGEIERDISNLPYDSVYIYQPSLLTGKRKENRTFENISYYIMQFLNPFLIGTLRKYRSISAKTVASAMYKQSLLDDKGRFKFPSDKIKEIS